MASFLCNKIYINNTTGVSLNERFTAMSTEPKITIEHRSLIMKRPLQHVNKATSRANQRFLAKLQRKHKIQAALMLKHRSMRTLDDARSSGKGAYDGNVKTFLMGANCKRNRTNSLANITIPNYDCGALDKSRVLRRSNSTGGLANCMGTRRLVVPNRHFEHPCGGVGVILNRPVISAIGRRLARNGSLTHPEANARNSSRGRDTNNDIPTDRKYSRSRYRIPARYGVGNTSRNPLPIKARLGVLGGIYDSNTPVQNKGVASVTNKRSNENSHNANLTKHGAQTGGFHKRQNSEIRRTVKSNIVANARDSRVRSRYVILNANKNNNEEQCTRSRSRTRKGQIGQQMENRVGKGQTQQQGRRERIQKRGGVTNHRQRGGKQAKPNFNLNKDVLDMELDLYMAKNKN